MKREQPGKYEEFIRDYQRTYCWAWTR